MIFKDLEIAMEERIKKVKVLTSGVFDILNLGHINILTQARSLGDYLICCVQDDASAFKSKGEKPILSIDERVDQIKAFSFIDEVVVYSDVDQRSVWKKLNPNIIVQGDDYIHSVDRTEALKYIKANHIRLILLPRTKDISTSIIKDRVSSSKKKVN